MNHRERISEIQMAVIMAGGFIELGLYSFPRHLLELAGRPFYPVLLTAVLVGLALSLSIAHVMLKYPRKTPIEIFKGLFGPYLGTLVGLWALTFHIILAGVCLRYFADLVNTYFLPRTPVETTMMLILLATLFVNAQGLAATARVIVLAFLPVMTMVVVAYLLTVTRMSEFEALVPVLGPISLPGFARSVSGILYLFIGVESIAFLLPLVEKPRRPYFWVAMPVLGNALVLLIALLVTLGVLGFEPAIGLQYPGITTLRVLRLPGILMERLGGVVALAWTALKLVYLSARLITIPMAMAQIFNLSVARYRPFLYPAGVMIFFVARWPSNVEELSWLMQWFVGPVGLLTNGGLVLLILLVGALRGRGQSA
ncbi:MAG: GerAB/ArcD/ProY family transporter [Bacillota bacterium]